MEICVFGTEDEHTTEDIGAWVPVPVKAFRPIGPRHFGYSPHFRPALDGFAPDLTHTHGLWLYPSIVTNQTSRSRHVPYVISTHGMLDPWAIRHARWKKAIAHFLYEGAHLREASCLRALCEAEARALRQAGLKNPIAIIPNGIDLPIIPNAENLKSEMLKAPWDGLVEPGRKVLLFLSRIHPKKGLVNLLRAWAEIRKSEIGNRKCREWVLVIAGWNQGGHEAELKRLCDELGIEWQDARGQKSVVSSQWSVVFLGPQFGAEKAACYRNCDAFILPSFSEGVPMVVLEAWANSKPVLMTPECNLPAGYAANAAIRIEPNVESIAQGLRELFQAPDSALQTVGDNGLRLAREQFAWPLLAAEMKRLYEWMLGGGDKPACIADF